MNKRFYALSYTQTLELAKEAIKQMESNHKQLTELYASNDYIEENYGRSGFKTPENRLKAARLEIARKQAFLALKLCVNDLAANVLHLENFPDLLWPDDDIRPIDDIPL